MTLKKGGAPAPLGRRSFERRQDPASRKPAPKAADGTAPAWRAPPSPQEAGFRFARYSADEGLATAGVGAAIAAAGFAAYMIASDASDASGPAFRGAEHLTLLAQPRAPAQEPEAAVEAAEGRPIDFDATGSIDRTSGRQRDGAAAGAASREDPAADRPSRSDPGAGGAGYVLRFVHKGVAIVQRDGKSYVVAPGASLPGAGRVLSIEKRASGWVVATAGGAILGAP